MRRLALVALAGVAGVVLAGAVGLGVAHVAIRRVRPPLPAPEALLRVDTAADLPIAVHGIDTARQPMPRAAVLDPAADPQPDAPYVMTHPAFVLSWADGRLFLIDAGMGREDALAFGAPLERFAGAGPIVPLRSLADQLGPAAARVRGVAFTHLHTDHTAGILGLCRVRRAGLPVFQSPAQADHANHTTWPGRAHLERAGCLEPRRLDDGPLHPVAGFPGLFVVVAAGHTPGSQVFVAHLRGPPPRVWIFTGDVVNHREGIRSDVPKPALYGALVVPEDGSRLAAVRAWLAALATRPEVVLAVSHDLAGSPSDVPPPWPGPEVAGRAARPPARTR